MSKETIWDKLRQHVSEREERQQQRAISIRHIKERTAQKPAFALQGVRAMREPINPFYTNAAEKVRFEREKEERFSGQKMLGMVIGVILMTALIIGIMASYDHRPARADTIPTIGFATYYTVASCLKESGQYRMANGRLLDDEKLTAASWYYQFGTKVIVTNRATGRSVIVTICDRGPSKRLVKKGKIIDLSRRAFREIAGLGQGVIPVTVKEVEI